MNYSLTEQATEDTWIDGSVIYEITLNDNVIGIIDESFTVIDFAPLFVEGGLLLVGEAFTLQVVKVSGVGWVWQLGQSADVEYIKVRYIKSVLT